MMCNIIVCHFFLYLDLIQDEEVLKGSSDGWVKEDSPMRTRNVKGSPAAKAC